LFEHYAAEETPVYAYAIPARTGNKLSPEVVRRLAAEGLGGVKDSTKSLERHREYVACGIDVLIGTDALVLDGFRAGAVGCVSALANVRPDLLCELRSGGGQEVQQVILDLRDQLPLQQLKTALGERIRGYPNRYRAPLG
jgi:dihydrodipicolinate synthase/N-acetylneuraminate lyase